MECAICFNQIVDKVSMTCGGQHPFCFKCLLQNVEANSELKSCPTCRGGDKFIMIPNDSTTSGANGFYSLEYFKKSLPIMQKILGNSVTENTCLISETMILFYVKNKRQLDAAHKLMSQGESIDAVASILKWESRSLEDIGIETIGTLAEMFGFGIPIPTNRTHAHVPSGAGMSPDQREGRPRRAQRDPGGRVVIGGDLPTFTPLQGAFPFLFSNGPFSNGRGNE